MDISPERELLQTWLHRVWTEEDASAIGEMFHGGDVRGLGAQVNMTPESFEIFHARMCGLLSDMVFTIDKFTQDGPWLVALCTLNARTQSNGEELETTGNMWVRIEDGQIKEAYNHFDFLELWGKLGLLPNDSFERGLVGEKIA